MMLGVVALRLGNAAIVVLVEGGAKRKSQVDPEKKIYISHSADRDIRCSDRPLHDITTIEKKKVRVSTQDPGTLRLTRDDVAV